MHGQCIDNFLAIEHCHYLQCDHLPVKLGNVRELIKNQVSVIGEKFWQGKLFIAILMFGAIPVFTGT